MVKNEKWVIALLIVISLLQLWLTKYVPSLDGPQHLYNANVIVELLKGNALFSEFFRINEVIVGYWSGHFFLSLFNLFLPAWLAEKFFLTAYVLGMFFSFRYLVRSISPGNKNLLVYLVFPFIFHMYLLLGYYSFSIAAIFYFWAFGYWIRKRDQFSWKEMVVFGSIVMGIFLSHGLVFLFFGTSFLIFFAATSIYTLVLRKGGSAWPGILSQVWRVAVSVIPSVVLWAIYIRVVLDINPAVAPTSYSTQELLKNLIGIRQLVGFSHEIESPIYLPLFLNIVLLGLLAFGNLVMGLQKGERRWFDFFSSKNVWAGITLMFLVAYFLMPDRISAGNLTNRFGLFFFLTLIIFLTTHSTPKILQILTLIVVVGVMGFTRYTHHEFLRKLNLDIRDIQEMTPYMQAGSTLFSLSSSDNWIHKHFWFYATDDKAIVHLRNPQCAGQFPVVWNEKFMPACFLGENQYTPGGSPEILGQGHRNCQVDYITIFYQQQFWSNVENQYWQDLLNEHFELVKKTSRELGALYQWVGK